MSLSYTRTTNDLFDIDDVGKMRDFRSNVGYFLGERSCFSPYCQNDDITDNEDTDYD
jgi:hypothetical protein